MRNELVHSMETAGYHPLIGITPRQEVADGMVVLKMNYAESVMAAGGTPYIIPIINDKEILKSVLDRLDGIVMTGGHDIDPARYGQSNDHAKLSELTPERDEMEAFILDYALEHDVPMLCVCRGMQFLNVHTGGTLHLDVGEALLPPEALEGNNHTPWIAVKDTLYPDVREEKARKASGASEDVLDAITASHGQQGEHIFHWQTIDYGLPSHYVNVEGGSKLAALIGAGKHAVNSMHHQGVRDVSPRVNVVARATDGLVEAIEVKDRTFILGTQWHPEFFSQDGPMAPIFDELVRQAKLFSQR